MKLWVQMKFHNLLLILSDQIGRCLLIYIPWIGVQSWALGQATLSHTMEGWGGKRGMPPSPLHNTWQCKPAMPPWAMAIEVNDSPNPSHWARIGTSDIEEAFSLIFTLSLSSPLLPASLMIVIKERVSVARNDLSRNQINSGHRIGLTKNNWSSQLTDGCGLYAEDPVTYYGEVRGMRWAFYNYSCAPSTPLPSTIHDSVTLQASGWWKEVQEMSSGKGSSNKKIQKCWCYTGKDFSIRNNCNDCENSDPTQWTKLHTSINSLV